ncbi:hypothetical protein [Aliarcobacter cibarius]|uniref:Cytochrome oxidase Cu insertion factor, SCO1/SenC/PrrC family n=1 Tax=Aliarcobacter cibarius TaxID=255507 RepID=A0A5J6RLE2_9BACT|nr:hypothetical protein [Aliarcobacter cibarius]QEZ89221.1 hypothetical protein ACIB15232_1104 [Aliarcobacter cibarius]QKJ27256.1 hypothetical protein ACBT_1347 [Aliarcobacter cibarius]TLT01525.1 hypothetical protein FE247_01180 [Aliarcobacter cibarius]TLT02016.1 hypothetical protein FE245_01180 [Aliarcobacter cibarius]
MKNIFKVVLLGIIGFGFLVYLTIPSEKIEKIEKVEKVVENLPKYFEIIGKDVKKEELFKKDSYIVLLNHDSLAVFKELYKKVDKNIVLIANISNTPWLIKNIAVDDELEKMYKESKIPLINDSNAQFRRFFQLNDDSQNMYIIYKVLENNQIVKIYQGSVKRGALQEGINIDELNKNLDEFLANLK